MPCHCLSLSPWARPLPLPAFPSAAAAGENCRGGELHLPACLARAHGHPPARPLARGLLGVVVPTGAMDRSVHNSPRLGDIGECRGGCAPGGFLPGDDFGGVPAPWGPLWRSLHLGGALLLRDIFFGRGEVLAPRGDGGLWSWGGRGVGGLWSQVAMGDSGDLGVKLGGGALGQ